MNAIDSYFSGIFSMSCRASSDLWSNYKKPLKRAKLKDILNIPGKTEFLSSEKNILPKNKKNESQSVVKSQISNFNSILDRADGKENSKKLLLSKSSSHLTNNSYLRRSSRIKNKLNIKVNGISDINESFVIVSPLKQFNHSIQNKKANVQSHLTQFKDISNLKVTDNNNNDHHHQGNVEVNNKFKNVLEKDKDETRSASKESALVKNSLSLVKRGRSKIYKTANLINSSREHHSGSTNNNNAAAKKMKDLKTTGRSKKGNYEVNRVETILEKGKNETLSIVSKESDLISKQSSSIVKRGRSKINKTSSLINISSKEHHSEVLINNTANKKKNMKTTGSAKKDSDEINTDLHFPYPGKIDFTRSQIKLRNQERKCYYDNDSEDNTESPFKNLKAGPIKSVSQQFTNLDKNDSTKPQVYKSRKKNCDATVCNNSKLTTKNGKQNKRAAREVLQKASKKMNNHESTENKGSNTERDKNLSSLIQSNENDIDKRKKARAGTLRYLKERQNALKKLLIEENPTDYVEVCNGKKSKALTDLLKMDENETLAIKTPNEKRKSKEPFFFTPRTAILDVWAKNSSCPSASTPKNDFKTKKKREEQGALNVLYHHLKNNPSKRRRKTNWCKDSEVQAKILKKQQEPDNFMDFNLRKGEEILNCLSQNPSQDLNEISFDDYFNMSS